MNWYSFQFDTQYLINVLVRLIAACILGGIIGFEREFTQHRPAGFRTHILVSLGSCLVMLISQFAVIAFHSISDVDPTRIGAQVVSGIGFLGAGAIIRHGASVKGITTAASIWAVACVGLACGFGFYAGAIIATFLIWAVLMYLKIIEERFTSKAKVKMIEVEAQSDKQVIVPMNAVFHELGLTINSVEITDNITAQRQRIQCQLACPDKILDYVLLSSKIYEIDGVTRVSI